MQKRWLFIPLMVGVALAGAAAPALADSAWKAVQSGERQMGSGQASHIEIRVEAGLDSSGMLLPDNYYCGQYIPCVGGALNFSIENKSDVVLKVTKVSLTTTQCYNGATPPCYLPILTDKNKDGTWNPSWSYGSTTCADFVTLTEPDFTTRTWPFIPPHGTLQVNGHDNRQLGANLIHLKSTTPTECQGASFYIPITVSAQDAS